MLFNRFLVDSNDDNLGLVGLAVIRRVLVDLKHGLEGINPEEDLRAGDGQTERAEEDITLISIFLLGRGEDLHISNIGKEHAIFVIARVFVTFITIANPTERTFRRSSRGEEEGINQRSTICKIDNKIISPHSPMEIGILKLKNFKIPNN